jgi:hypothetical protein
MEFEVRGGKVNRLEGIGYILRARKRSSDRMAMALVRRMTTIVDGINIDSKN